MAKIGHLVNGKFVTVAKDFDIADVPGATEKESGLMTPIQVQKLDAAYTSNDIADKEKIESLFD